MEGEKSFRVTALCPAANFKAPTDEEQKSNELIVATVQCAGGKPGT